MNLPYNIECSVCHEYPGTAECSSTGHDICSCCLEKNDINAKICINNKAFTLLKKMINTGKISTNEFGPSLNISAREEAMQIKKQFLSNTEKKMECFGASGWGSYRQYIYRHTNGIIYTFCLTGYIDDDNIICLKKYTKSIDFPRDFGFDLV